jgi:Inward rectifier potassium channel C-terminal domain
MFILSWMLFHVIDKESPLYGATSADLAKDDALLVLNVGGLDDSSAQATVCQARLFVARYPLAAVWRPYPLLQLRSAGCRFALTDLPDSAVLFGKEDILINNIAWALRYLPFFGLYGDG